MHSSVNVLLPVLVYVQSDESRGPVKPLKPAGMSSAEKFVTVAPKNSYLRRAEESNGKMAANKEKRESKDFMTAFDTNFDLFYAVLKEKEDERTNEEAG